MTIDANGTQLDPKVSFLQMMKSQLEDWNKELAPARQQLKSATKGLDGELRALMLNFKKRKENFKACMEEIQEASSDKFEWLKPKAQRAWLEANLAVEKFNLRRVA